MSAADRAEQTLTEAVSLRRELQNVFARAAAGQPVEAVEINRVLQLARITEFHALRTKMAIAIGPSHSRKTDKPEVTPCP